MPPLNNANNETNGSNLSFSFFRGREPGVQPNYQKLKLPSISPYLMTFSDAPAKAKLFHLSNLFIDEEKGPAPSALTILENEKLVVQLEALRRREKIQNMRQFNTELKSVMGQDNAFDKNCFEIQRLLGMIYLNDKKDWVLFR